MRALRERQGLPAPLVIRACSRRSICMGLGIRLRAALLPQPLLISLSLSVSLLQDNVHLYIYMYKALPILPLFEGGASSLSQVRRRRTGFVSPSFCGSLGTAAVYMVWRRLVSLGFNLAGRVYVWIARYLYTPSSILAGGVRRAEGRIAMRHEVELCV